MSRICKWRPDGTVDILLHDHESTSQVYWSERRFREENGKQVPAGGFNSYVLVEATQNIIPGYGLKYTVHDGNKPNDVYLVSINGRGEVRWFIYDSELGSAMMAEKEGRELSGEQKEILAVARWFRLIERRPQR